MIFFSTYKDSLTKPSYKIYIQYLTLSLIVILLSFSQFNCGDKNTIISQEKVEIIFVTKKDVNLYSDAIEKIVVDEIPAFIKLIAIEKITLLDDSKDEKIFYKTIFNKKEGWVNSIYLASIKTENKPSLKTQNGEGVQIPPLTNKNKINTQSKVKELPSKKSKKYYVQIASFKNEVNAKKLYKKVKLDNVLLSLEKVNTPNGLFYRIITNNYNTKEKALISLNKIKKINTTLSPIIKVARSDNSQEISQPKVQKKIGKTEYYTIQLSSFENKSTAEKFAKKMTNLGYPSKVTEAWVKGKVWFRVQHGEYKMIAVAKQVSTKLKNKYKFNPWISNIYK